MCGIAGIVHPNAAARGGEVAEMLARIAHRGRDGREIWAGDGCVIGHNRLAIIDLTETGRQPMTTPSGHVTAAVNGEIYNHAELRRDLEASGRSFRGRSDAEPVPHLYERDGAGFVSRLHGMFAIALWDAAARRLILARDRLGKKPLFYAPIPGGLAFASEMKALFALADVDVDIRPQAVADYLVFGAVPGAETVYRGILRVPPGHVATVEAGGGIDVRPYWTLNFVPKLALGRDAAAEALLPILERAVARRLESDVTLGCFLSGGIDSGLVAALAARASSAPLNTYAVGVLDPALDERALARLSAEALGTHHAEFVVDAGIADIETAIGHFDEPFADASAVPSFAVARRAARDVSVVLNGDGGDELFCGYRHFVAARQIEAVERTAGQTARAAARLAAARLPAPEEARSHYQFLHRVLRALAAAPLERPLVLTSDLLDEGEMRALFAGRGIDESPLRHVASLDLEGLGAVDTMTAFDVYRLLGDQHLVKMDMASMAATLEARSPLLDHEVAEFAAHLPESVKLDGGETKPLLRALARRILPAAVADAPKKGFEVPVGRWMRNELSAPFRDRLAGPASFAAAHFDRAVLGRFLAGDGWDAKRWGAVAWSLYCLEIWWERARDRDRNADAAGRGTPPIAAVG